MEDLDLVIENYTVGDLERLFQFAPQTHYTRDQVISREAKIRTAFLSMGAVEPTQVRALIDFLSRAKMVLIYARCDATAASAADPLPMKRPRHDPSWPSPPASTTSFLPDTFTKVPDHVNPLVHRAIHKCVTIDSRFREPYDMQKGSDFVVKLPFTLPKVVSINVHSFEIPVSFYCFDEKRDNHYLYLRIVLPAVSVDDPSPEEERVFFVAPGNYNAMELIQAWNAVFSALPLTDPFSTFVFSLDINEHHSGTGKVTVTTTHPTMLSFVLDASRDRHLIRDARHSIQRKMGWHLGFRKTVYEGARAYVSESIIDPAVTRYLYLVVDDFQNNVHDHYMTCNFESSLNNKKVLARIPVKQLYFGMMMETDVSAVTLPRIYFGPVDLHKLHIRLLDDFGQLVELNGADFSFALNVSLLREE
jgi:hypothetical protein